jgi:cysteine desulfurase/selenocysteine lyase
MNPLIADDAFPILTQHIHGKRLVYLDSGASAQKFRCVIDAMSQFYEHDYANIHRGVHELSQRATQKYDEARRAVQKFLGAAHEDEIVFTRGATEALNLVVSSWGSENLKDGDNVVLTELEHHANIVPWQLLQKRIRFNLHIVPIQKNGDVLFEDVKAAIDEQTKIVSVSHVSNAFGTILPVQEIIAYAHERGIPVLIDGSQAVSHIKIDVQTLDADFYVFSGHKLYGPSGIGALYGKRDILKRMPPYQGGGDMILSVSFKTGTTFQDPPMRFEAGTPAIAEAIGLKAAIDFLNVLGMDKVEQYEKSLLDYATEKLKAVDGVRLIGTAPHRASILSFIIEGVHPHDAGTIFDHCGVAVRAGHHCAQPAMEALGLTATIRASLALYNTCDDIDMLVEAIHKTKEMFK